MADPFDTDPLAPHGSRAKEDLNARFQDLRRDAATGAKAAADTVSQRYGGSPGQGTDASTANLRDQASQAASDAKGVAASIAEQARQRVSEIVDQQKAAGADRIAGVAKAAHSAAADLDGTSPHMARLVRTAAEGVDRVAEDVRSRSIGDVFDTLADFGRRQPVAFFGGAVVAGFLLSRFFKSDVPLVDEAALYRDRPV